MISVLLSEGLAPSNGAKSQEPREPSRPNKDESFSSYLDKKDRTSDVDDRRNEDGPHNANGLHEADRQSAASANENRETSTDGDRGSRDETGTAEDTATPQNGAKSSKVDRDAVAANYADGQAQSKTDSLQVVASDETPQNIQVADTEAASSNAALSATDFDPTKENGLLEQTEADFAKAPTVDAAGDARRLDGERTAQLAGTDPSTAGDSDLSKAFDARAAQDEIKLSDPSGQSARDGNQRLTASAGQIDLTGEQIERSDADFRNVADLTSADLADINMQRQSLSGLGDDPSILSRLGREIAPTSVEGQVQLASLVHTSAPTSVSTVGLTPTAPTHVIAAPNELTSVIMNALKNGGDVQEQLVVQLDPPELGRVLIDFKFDAQGLQQITVTSENPEALKRLRELHFELTEALKGQGLGDSNLSFQEQARDQSQQHWQAPEWGRGQSQVGAAADREVSRSAAQTVPNIQSRDRLDLKL